jgi:hypothetical protein
VLVVLLAGCAHDAVLEDGVLRKGALAVQFGPVPTKWRPVPIAGADVAFRDDPREGSTLVDVRCDERDHDAPLGVLTEHLIMGTTERQVTSQETLPFDHREALHTLMRAKLDGVPMQYDIYVMKKDGCVFDLVYVAPPERFGEGAEDFERFAHGLHAASPPVSTAGAGHGRSAASPEGPAASGRSAASPEGAAASERSAGHPEGAAAAGKSGATGDP